VGYNFVILDNIGLSS